MELIEQVQLHGTYTTARNNESSRTGGTERQVDEIKHEEKVEVI